jgi:hypothetical protein
MRLSFALPGLLAACLMSAAARADTVDNFVLTGNGQTETWSLPSPDPYAIQPHLELIFFQTTVTTNGVPATEDVDFYEAGVGLTVNGLYGPPVVSFSGGPAGYVDVTFRTGTFALVGYSVGAIGSGVPIDYSLTITPATTATPEPSSLVLLATGVLGLGPVLRRRLRGVRPAGC